MIEETILSIVVKDLGVRGANERKTPGIEKLLKLQLILSIDDTHLCYSQSSVSEAEKTDKDAA